MLEFLGLGEAQLFQAALRDDLAEQVVHAAAFVHGGQGAELEFVVVAGEAAVHHVHLFPAAAGVIILDEVLGELDGAVLAEVEVHHGVAVLHAGVIAYDGGGDVFVHDGQAVGVFQGGVGVVEGGFGVRGSGAFGFGDGVIGSIGELPFLAAVHGVVAAHDGADGGYAHFFDDFFEHFEEGEGGARRRVAAVCEEVDVDFLDADLFGLAHDGVHVVLVGMDALVLDEAHQVEG